MKSLNITRRRFIDWMIRGGICAGLGYPIALEPNWFALEQIDVPIPGLPTGLNGLRIGFMADFHRGRFVTEGDISRAAGHLQPQKPDLFLLGGDFVENKADYIHSCLKVLSKLEAPLGTYAVLGNHDYWSDADIIRAAIGQTRIRLLDNESVRLKWKGANFYLLGLDDAWEGRPNMKAALRGVAPEAMKILLVHEPDYADRIKKMPVWLPVQVSGHSHGGQVVLPFWGPPILP